MGTAICGPKFVYYPVRIANARMQTYHSGLHRRETERGERFAIHR